MRSRGAVSTVHPDLAKTVTLPNQIHWSAALRERLVLLRIPIGGTRGRADGGEYFRKVSVQPFGATCAALHQRGSSACEHLRCLLLVAPTLRLALQSFASARSRVHRRRS